MSTASAVLLRSLCTKSRSAAAGVVMLKAASAGVASTSASAGRAGVASGMSMSSSSLVQLRWNSAAAAPAAKKVAPPPPSPPPAASSSTSSSSTSLSGGLLIKELKGENPYVNVVRYEHKNRTWTTHHVDYYSNAVAIGFLDGGMVPGDIVLNLMPPHWAETMVLQFACSKAGLVLYTLDAELAVRDTELAKTALKQALTLSKANVLVSPEAYNDVNFVRFIQGHEHMDMDGVLPELLEFDTQRGAQFLAPLYPHLRYCIQTGFEDEGKRGWTRMAHFVVPAGDVETDWLRDYPTMTGKTPLLGQFVMDEQGIPIKLGATLTNEQVIQQKKWDTYCKILEKNFHNVDGVGVIW